jgi:glycolate oxidase iron-sulfur subunit
MDSPRGRIYLMREGLDGEAMSGAMVEHIDRCLGCMACVTACPSGVRYDRLIEATRAQVERRHRRPLSERLKRAAIFFLFPYRQRLAVARRLLAAYQASGVEAVVARTGLSRLLPPFLQAMNEVAPRIGPDEPLAELAAGCAPRRGTVGLLRGCVQGSFFPAVNAATVRVLTAEGYDVVCPPEQGCCGALSLHAGRENEARQFARAVIDCFEEAGVEVVIVNAAGCGSAMKTYGELLSGDPTYREAAARLATATRDVAEFLAAIEPRAPRHQLPVRLAYHDACHLAHAQGVRTAPRAILRAIDGVELLEIAEGDLCCGSAGIYNLLEPVAARELGRRKATCVEATGAELLVAANPGCTLQIAAAARRLGRPVATAHTIEVLDASLRGLTAAELLAACAPTGPRDRTAP